MICILDSEKKVVSLLRTSLEWDTSLAMQSTYVDLRSVCGIKIRIPLEFDAYEISHTHITDESVTHK